MRQRLTGPGLRDLLQIVIRVVVESDGASERVGNRGDVAEPVVVDGDVIAVAIFDLRAVPLIIELQITELRPIGCAHQQTAAIVDELQIR